jgi:hypothetical protein
VEYFPSDGDVSIPRIQSTLFFGIFSAREKCLRNDKNPRPLAKTVSLKNKHHCLSVKDRLQSNIGFLQPEF